MKSIDYRTQTQDGPKMVTAALTEKSATFDEISIKGVRWFSAGTTYHKAYISVRVGDTWHELGSTVMHSGFDDHYLVTAGDWLITNGYMVAESGYALGTWPVRDALGVTYYAQDVKRKKDM